MSRRNSIRRKKIETQSFPLSSPPVSSVSSSTRLSVKERIHRESCDRAISHPGKFKHPRICGASSASESHSFRFKGGFKRAPGHGCLFREAWLRATINGMFCNTNVNSPAFGNTAPLEMYTPYVHPALQFCIGPRTNAPFLAPETSMAVAACGFYETVKPSSTRGNNTAVNPCGYPN